MTDLRSCSILLAAPAALGLSAPATASGEERHVVYDLLANRAHAHLLRGNGILIDAGSWSFPRYLNGNVRGERWSLGVSSESETVAVARKRETWLYVPVGQRDAPHVRRLEMRVRPARGGVSMTVKLNGSALPGKTLEAGWQTVAWVLDEGAVASGENRIDLDFGGVGRVLGRQGAGALHWLRLDDGSAGEPDLALEAAGGGLHVPEDGGLVWYVFAGEGARVHVTFGGAPASCGLKLLAENGQEGVQETRATAPGGDFELDLDPTTLGADVVRLVVSAEPGCGEVRLTKGGLTLPGPAATWTRTAPVPKRVILYIIDTLRADRLKAWNPDSRVRTPVLDRLSREGAVYLQNYSQGNESYVSHAAIFTGEFPMTNGVYTGERKLHAQHLLVSEVVRAAGLRTGGFTSNGYIDVRNGYLQGWHTYVNALIQKKPYKAPGLLRQARSWVDDQGDRPYFLYVGTVDPHVSYRAHAEILPLYDPAPYSGRYRKVCSGDELGRIKGRGSSVTPRDRVRIEALYDNEVDFSDRHLGEFVQFLEEKGQLDETMLIITSDHGDEFWEHGDVGHGHSLYEELVHVPLIIRYPPMWAAGTRVTEGVDTVDIFPTIIDALGIEMPERLQGESLLPLAHGVGRGYPRPSVATRNGRTYAMRLARYKMILSTRGKRRVFDLATDPTEQRDVLARHPVATRILADAAGLFIAYEKGWKKRSWGVASNLLGVPD